MVCRPDYGKETIRGRCAMPWTRGVNSRRLLHFEALSWPGVDWPPTADLAAEAVAERSYRNFLG